MNCSMEFFNAIKALENGKELTLADRIIFIVSNPLTHVEWKFSERYGNLSCSATMRDNLDCVRKKRIDYTIHPHRWTRLQINLSDGAEDRAMRYFERIEGKPYDKLGVLSLRHLDNRPHLIKPNPDMYWCSEVVGGMYNESCNQNYPPPLRPDTLTPNDLFFRVFELL